MGYNKLMCSLLKYIPQLLWNRTRRCTFGWSIFSVLMDLTGGIFSVLETVLETLVVEHFRINITKLILGSLTIVYDLLFVYQHYVLYPSVIEDQKSFEKMEFDSPSTVEMERSIEMQ
jgi:cystinosin